MCVIRHHLLLLTTLLSTNNSYLVSDVDIWKNLQKKDLLNLIFNSAWKVIYLRIYRRS